jgi:hypothetical protein
MAVLDSADGESLVFLSVFGGSAGSTPSKFVLAMAMLVQQS